MSVSNRWEVVILRMRETMKISRQR